MVYIKDCYAVLLLSFILSLYIFIGDGFFSESLNNVEVDILSTPLEMVPE